MGTLEASRPPRVAGALPVGTVLGRFELLGLLSVGGMAEIYLARSEGIAGFEKLVVVKRMLPHFAMQAEFVEMFLAEARLGAMLDHPNVVAVHDIGEETGNYYYAMDYVRGADLRQIMKVQGRQGAMPLHCAISIGLGMCAGLDHAHGLTGHDGNALGVVHRDVSLSNVLVSYDGAVKVTDFGVAKLTADDHRTRTGTLKGKIGYMSPEQCRGLALDRRSDIFAIGIILYELSTGRRLFRPEESDFAILEKIVKKDVVPPSRHRPDYPPELEAIVLKALQRDRTQRYQTARDMQRDLERLARTERLPISATELAEYVRVLVPPTSPGSERRHAPTTTPPTRRTGPSAALAARPPTEAPVDPWVNEYESLMLGDAEALAGLTATPRADARSRRRALLVLGGAALLGVVFAVLVVPAEQEPTAEAPHPQARRAAVEPPPGAARPPSPPTESATQAARPAAAAMPAPANDAVRAAIVAPRPDPARASREPERPRAREREVAHRTAARPARIDSAPSRGIDAGAAPAPSPDAMLILIDELEPAEPATPPPPTTAPATRPRPQPAPPRPAVVDAPDAGSFDAVPSIAGVNVSGPLQDSEIRRGVGRVTSAFRSCYRDAARDAGKTPAAKVRITFEIDERRAARNISAGRAPLPGLSSCLERVTAGIRTRIAPDVGNAQVTVDVSFSPTDP